MLYLHIPESTVPEEHPISVSYLTQSDSFHENASATWSVRDGPQSSRHTRRRHTDLGSNVFQSQATPPQLHDQAAASYTVRGRTNRYLSPSGNSHLFNTHRTSSLMRVVLSCNIIE